jgi:hypothetical protein
MKGAYLVAGLAALLTAGCNFDLTNPNSPEPIGTNPSRSQVAAAVTGLLIGARGDAADWNLDVGIMGREGYRFDGSDPRFISELLTGTLDPGSGAFGGDHWFEFYQTVRSANTLLSVIGTSSALSSAEQNGTMGVARTIKALELLFVANGHTEDSIPIAVETSITAPPAPFVTHVAAMDYISALLDSAAIDLSDGGASFPFELSSGFSGFDTPAGFLKFNRALKARVELYRGNFASVLTALGGSFLDASGGPMNVGVYHVYSTGAGDNTNPLSQNPLTGENFAHPSLESDAELQADDVTLDQRFLDKTIPRSSTTTSGLTSALGWIRYPSASSSIPIIKNEELILIRAEANIGLDNLALATNDINVVRQASGLLPPIGVPGTPTAALDAVLYERRYSLLYEGHRWVDMRRLGRLGALPLDRPGDVVHPTYPIPTDEVLARQ